MTTITKTDLLSNSLLIIKKHQYPYTEINLCIIITMKIMVLKNNSLNRKFYQMEVSLHIENISWAPILIKVCIHAKPQVMFVGVT